MKVLLAQPFNNDIIRESRDALHQCCEADGLFEITAPQYPPQSLLCQSFNEFLADAKDGDYDFMAMLHSDVAPGPGWLSRLYSDMGTAGIIHAPVAIKDVRGLTSTAVAFSDDPWAPRRRISTTELFQLPEVFGIDEVREIMPGAIAILPNTGCLMLGRSVIDGFPCFDMLHRIQHTNGKRIAEVVSEDWFLGYWAMQHGIEVRATRNIRPRHFGEYWFTVEKPWGTKKIDDSAHA